MASIAATKTLSLVNGVAPAAGYQVKSGDVLTYNIALVNSTAGAGVVTLTETVPTNTTYSSANISTDTTANSGAWVAGGGNYTLSVTVGASATVNKIFTVTVGTLTGGAGMQTIANTVSASGAACTGTSGAGCTVTTATTPYLSVAKSVPSSLSAGGTASYTVTITNTGGSATSGAVTFTDTLPVGLTFAPTSQTSNGFTCTSASPYTTVSCTASGPNIAANGGNVAVTYTVAVSTSATGTLINQVQLTALGGDPRTANIAGLNTTTLTAGNGSQSTDKLYANSAQVVTVAYRFTLAKTQTTASTVTTGAIITYQLSLGNSGSAVSGTSFTVKDQLPAGVIATGVTAGVNVSTISCTDGTHVLPTASTAGSMLTCTGTLTSGLAASTANGGAVFTITALAPAGAGLVTNYATVGSAGGVPTNPPSSGTCPDTSCGSVTTTINTPANVIYKKTVDKISAIATDSSLTYTITLGNSGGSPSGTVLHVYDQLPSGVQATGVAVGNNVSNVACTNMNIAGATLDCTVTTSAIAAGTALTDSGASTFTITTTMPGVGTVINYAQVSGSGGVINSPTPATATCAAPSICSAQTVVVSGLATIFVQKMASAQSVELGDSLLYTVSVTVKSGSAQSGVVVTDTLPRGFKYIPNSARVTVDSVVVSGDINLGIVGVGPVININAGTVQLGDAHAAQITYRVRVGVGAQQGDGVNRVIATSASGSVSNEARYKVTVTDGVFTSTSCVVGKVYIDCNGNGVQDNDEDEMGIPGVRLYMEDGTYLISDNKGKYSICGLTATTHVFKVDPITLPKGSVLLPSSNRNAGDPGSIFADLKFGELHRADFIEGTCSPDVLKQTRTRQEKAVGARDGVPLPALTIQAGGTAAPLQRVPMASPGQAVVDPLLKGERQEMTIRFDSEKGQDPFCSSEFPTDTNSPATVCPVNQPGKLNQPNVGGVR